jgi:hypothetical protein
VEQLEVSMSVDRREALQRNSSMRIYSSSHSRDRYKAREERSLLESAWVHMNRFVSYFHYYLEQALVSQNVDALGPSWVRPAMGWLFFILSSIDIAAVWYIIIIYRCIFEVTSCSNSDGVILIMAVYPGALLLAPLSGIFATALGPNAKYARAYSVWGRLAGVSCVVVLLIYISFAENISIITGYVVIYLVFSRILQCLLVDIYVAHIEKMRWGRGWDGLSTCLYVTKDHRFTGSESKD